MTIEYKLKKDLQGNTTTVVRSETGHPVTYQFTPGNMENRHAIEYKEWVDAGNTPEAAD